MAHVPDPDRPVTAAGAPLSVAARIKRRWFLELAGWCRTLKQNDNALRYLHEALRVAPGDPEVFACLGYHHAQQGRRREALQYFERAVEREPGNAETRFDCGFVLQELNDHEAAIAAFRGALEINPNHDRALYGLALSLIALRRLDEAVPPLEKNTKLQPFSPYGWYQLGRVQFNRGKPDKTQAIIEHLGTFEPKVARQLARETGLIAPPRP